MKLTALHLSFLAAVTVLMLTASGCGKSENTTNSATGTSTAAAPGPKAAPGGSNRATDAEPAPAGVTTDLSGGRK
jgi:hypothetical protein